MAEGSLLLKNAVVYTLEPGVERADAVLFRDGEVAWVGSMNDAPAGQEEIDLGGRVVVPGFVDSHIHMLWIAQDRLDVSLGGKGISEIADVLDAISDLSASRGSDEWIVAIGLNDFVLKEQRLPNRWEMDRVSGSHPVYLRRFCGHSATANSKALELAGITNDTADPPGGLFEREGGRPNGLLRELAMHQVYDHAPKPEISNVVDALFDFGLELHSFGVTGACEAAVGFTDGFSREWAIWQEVKSRDVFPQRMDFMLRIDPALARKLRVRPNCDDPDWRVATLKFFADGIVGARTAAFSASYPDCDHAGMLQYDPRQFRALVEEAAKDGWQCAVHAIGDRAIDLVSGVYKEVAARALNKYPLRVEHLALPAPTAIEDLLLAKAAIVQQHSFIPMMGDGFRGVLGDESARRLYPVHSLLEKGALIVGSSDAPAGSVSPLAGMGAACNRTTASGWKMGADEAVSPIQALESYTVNAAKLTGIDGARKMLRPGALGDAVVLNGDPFRRSDLFREIKVDATICRGKLVYTREGAGNFPG